MSDSPPPGPPLPNTYLIPTRSLLLPVSAAIVGACLLIAAASFLLGNHRVASPGLVARAHAAVAGQCAACHQPWIGVTNVRCEACHDARDRGLYTNMLHTRTARSRPTPIAMPGPADCRSCHTEHRGAGASLTPAADRTCVGCHAGSWEAHPDFSPFQTSTVAADSLRFSHALHLPEARKTLDKSCDACHERPATAPHFEPISFDRHCASCHVKNGVLDQIRQKSDKPHRDRATLEQAARLSRLLDPDAVHRERSLVFETLATAEALAAGDGGDGSDRSSRSGERAALAREWSRKGIERVVPKPSRRDVADREALDSLLRRLKERLAQLDAPVASAPSAEPVATETLTRLLTPCLACHVLDGTRLRPVTAARPTLTAATFTHAPHVNTLRQTCESCHETTERSGRAAELNLPHVNRCQSCHGVTPGASTSCMSCHEYHRRPSAVLRAWTPAGSF